MAVTRARSSGGKRGLSASSFQIRDGVIATGPAAPPALDLPRAQADDIAGRFAAELGSLVQEKDQAKPLHLLHRGRSLPNGQARLLQKPLGKATKSGSRSRHNRHPFQVT